MITIGLSPDDDKKVRLSMYDGGLAEGWTFFFDWNANDEPYAALLTERLRQSLSNHAAALREQAYNDGYRDGRGKRRKRRTFSASF